MDKHSRTSVLEKYIFQCTHVVCLLQIRPDPTQAEHLSSAPPLFSLLIIMIKIRQCRKWYPKRNNLAYFLEHQGRRKMRAY
jgi:hypothetical protein